MKHSIANTARRAGIPRTIANAITDDMRLIAAILIDTDNEEYADKVTGIREADLEQLVLMVKELQDLNRTRSEIAFYLKNDIGIMTETKPSCRVLACFVKQYMPASIYRGLRLHEDKEFFAGDTVTYTGKDGKQKYAALQYSSVFGAFTLLKFTDATFRNRVKPSPEESSVDFFFEVGYETLALTRPTGWTDQPLPIYAAPQKKNNATRR